MSMKRSFILTFALCLLIVSSYGLMLTGGRVVAAFLDYWKFSDSPSGHGIDLGAKSIFEFMMICLLGSAACLPLTIFSMKQNDKLLYRISVSANVIYFLNGALIFAMVSSGIAFFYCGR